MGLVRVEHQLTKRPRWATKEVLPSVALFHIGALGQTGGSIQIALSEGGNTIGEH
jgi:hypothetical protein